MGIYQTVCHKIEDVFVKVLTRKHDSEQVKIKVESYRKQKDEEKIQKKAVRQAKDEEQQKQLEKKRAEQERIHKENEAREKQEIENILSPIVDPEEMTYTSYEYQEVKRNKAFFNELPKRVFEPNEKGLTFLFCEFDKSSKKEIKGYLIVTNKRVLFLTKDFTFMDKYRYQTIINVNWFKDGLLERGIYIQYGKRRLEFDEIYDSEQLKRVGNLILNLATNKK